MARIFVDANGPYLNENDEMAEVGTPQWEAYSEDMNPADRDYILSERKLVDDWCSNHPVLRRLFPGYKLGIR